MNLKEKIINIALEALEKELDKQELESAKSFFENEMENEDFQAKVRESSEILNYKRYGEREFYILNLMLLGLGRNRTSEILTKHNMQTGRREVEKVRDLCDFKYCKEKKRRENFITKLKWETKTRKKREKDFENVDFEELKLKYLAGKTTRQLEEEYGVSHYLITTRLSEEGLVDIERSTLLKKKRADENYSTIDDNYIRKLVKENPLTSMEEIWHLSKEKYPWILRRQFLTKIKELGLERTKEESDKIKGLKSFNSKMDKFTTRKEILSAVNEVYGSLENLIEKQKTGEAGSYGEIAEKLTKENSLGVEITRKQAYRIITKSASSNQNQSLAQQELHKELCKLFPNVEILEEEVFGEYRKRVDIYIPEFKVAIDYNGEYWHSDFVIGQKTGKSSYLHHKERIEDLKDENVRLLYVWEDDWINNKKKILSSLKKKDWNHPVFRRLESNKNPSDGPAYRKYAKNILLRTAEDLGFNCKIEGDSITLLDFKETK